MNDPLFDVLLAGDEIASPNFKDFMDSDGPFQLPSLPLPEVDLEPTKFSINDNARNFPKEAIERLGQGLSHFDSTRKYPLRGYVLTFLLRLLTGTPAFHKS